MKHPASQHLFDYWNALRADRAAPDRRDIDPAAIRSILADILMIEVEPRGPSDAAAFSIRLAGTRVNALFGFDLKGRCMRSLWRLRDQSEVAALMAAVLDETRPAVLGVKAAPAGESPLPLELLLLPLRHKGKTHARLLATLSPAVAPDWLGLRPVTALALGPHRMIDPHPARSTVVARDFARPRVPGRRHGPFMIYEGGRM